MKIIKLEPLSKTALSTQLRKHAGKHWGHNDFAGKPITDGVITDLKTLQQFRMASQQEEDDYKAEEEKKKEIEEERKSKIFDNYGKVIIDFNNSERWKEGLKKASEDMTKAVEMCAEAYDHFLNCLPPLRFDSVAFICSEPYDENKRGQNIYLCAIKVKGKYYAQYGTAQQYDKKELFKSLPE